MRIKNIGLIVFLLILTARTTAESISIDLTLPNLNVDPYHRPYIAIWLESKERKGVRTIAVWHEKDDWLKDLRQWWRKIGRNGKDAYDAMSSATRKPGHYSIHWNHKNQSALSAGEYWLCFEAAREAGGRDFFRQKIYLGSKKSQHYTIDGDIELGQINISIQP